MPGAMHNRPAQRQALVRSLRTGSRKAERLWPLPLCIMTVTDDATRDALLRKLRQLSASERFVRALTLSAYVRRLTWQGARRHSAAPGATAVVDRFLTQQ